MPTGNKFDQNWYRVQRSRKFGKESREGYKFGSRKSAVVVGFLVMMAGLWSIVAIYGPVLVAESLYQYRNLVGGITGNFGSWNAFRLPNQTLPALGQWLKGNGMGMVIPKIYLKEQIIDEVSPADKPTYMQALQYGIAHASGTANPGEPGLGYYFAHSSGMNVLFPQKKAAFYLLGKLETGDTVYISYGGRNFVYQVTGKQITGANDLSFLTNSDPQERIVLQTCWPIGTSLKRLLVFANRSG